MSKKIIPSLVFLLVFNACQDMLINAPPAVVGSGIPITTEPPPLNEENPIPQEPKTTWGVVKCNNSQESITAFNAQVKAFLSASMNPNSIQWVKCAYTKEWESWKGGFFIRGKVSFENQALLDPRSYLQNLSVSSNSYLELHITNQLTGELVRKPPIGMKIDSLETTINPPSAKLVFKDLKGKITMEGRFQQKENTNVFEGSLHFQNNTDWKGSPQGAQGTIGLFSISTCSLFDCKKQ